MTGDEMFDAAYAEAQRIMARREMIDAIATHIGYRSASIELKEALAKAFMFGYHRGVRDGSSHES